MVIVIRYILNIYFMIMLHSKFHNFADLVLYILSRIGKIDFCGFTAQIILRYLEINYKCKIGKNLEKYTISLFHHKTEIMYFFSFRQGEYDLPSCILVIFLRVYKLCTCKLVLVN